MNNIKELISKNKTSYLFILPYVLMFTIFIALPVIMAILLSFTFFNAIEKPTFIGLANYVNLLTQDREFMQYVLPNTIKFALVVGVGGYALSFFLAWSLAQLPQKPRTILALIIYSPSLTVGVAMTVMWKIVFSGDSSGYLNALLLNWNLISEPIQWLTSPEYLLPIMMIISIWSSMGIGFLAMLAGVLNINPELYEVGALDGIKNRFQETFYITIPAMRPQMLFGAVMAVVGTFNAGIGVLLTGQNPTPQYAGQLMVNHIEDYGFIRFEMGYAAAISVVLLAMVYFLGKVSARVFGDK